MAVRNLSRTAWRALSSKSALSLEPVGNVAGAARSADGYVHPPHTQSLFCLLPDQVCYINSTDSQSPVFPDRHVGNNSRLIEGLPAQLCTQDNIPLRPVPVEVLAEPAAGGPAAAVRPYITLASTVDSCLVGLASSGAQQVKWCAAGSSGGMRRWSDTILSRPSHPHRHLFSLVGGQPTNTAEPRRYSETRVIGYTPEQLFDVVADVDRYADFLPWCLRSQVLWRRRRGEREGEGGERMEAELEIGFNVMREKYRSHITMKRPIFIHTTSSDTSLFDHLINEWRFSPGPSPSSCTVLFSVDFQFKNELYRQVLNLFFDDVVACLVASFEKRCEVVYGPAWRKAPQQKH